MATVSGQVLRSYAAAGPDEVRSWEAHNARELIAVRCEVAEVGSLRATQTNLELSRLHIATVTAGAHRVLRPAEVVERHPTDSVISYVMLGAAGVVESGGRRRVMRHGEAVAFDADRPFDREFSRGVGEFAIKVSRSELRNVLGIDVRVEPRAGSDLVTHALTRTAATLIRTAGIVPVDELATLELVGLQIGGDATPPDVRHRVAARAYIEAHLCDNRLSASGVAAAIGISDRQLSRVFAATGTSVPRHILGRRLELARSLLLGPASVSTADVARAVGVASRGHFSQAFRERFGVTAGEVRRSRRSSARKVPVSAIPDREPRQTLR